MLPLETLLEELSPQSQLHPIASSTMNDDIFTLTDNQRGRASLRLFNKPVSSAEGISITFDFYSYGGTGGDGISVFLVDGSQTPTRPGGFGGALGYAPRTPSYPGLLGGYVGIGFDEFGNFSNPVDGRVGGPGSRPDSIAVRGSQALNYAYLTGTGTLSPGLDTPGPSATRDTSRKRAQVDLSPVGQLKVQVDLNNDGDFNDPGEQALDFNVRSVNSPSGILDNGALPATLKFGFAASTGGDTNFHEVGNVQVRTLISGKPIFDATSPDTTVFGTDSNDSLGGGTGNDTIQGLTGNDVLTGGDGRDSLTGDVGDDVLIGGAGGDTLSGGPGADRFVYSATTKRGALSQSLFPANKRDRITDFSVAEGDKIQLDFDNNLATPQLPKALFNAGVQKVKTLRQAVQAAYGDKNQRQNGKQGLKKDEAVFFKFKKQTYLSVNDQSVGFAVNRDMVIDITDIKFAPGDANAGVLTVTNYFV